MSRAQRRAQGAQQRREERRAPGHPAPNVSERAMAEAAAAWQRGDPAAAVARIGSPDDPAAWCVLSAACSLAGNAAGGERAAVQALCFDPDLFSGYYLLAYARMLGGKIGGGLAAIVAYHDRHGGAGVARGLVERHPQHLRWRPGQPLAGRRILLHDFDNLGEVVLYASLLPELFAAVGDAGGVVLCTEARHHAWLARSFPRLELVAVEDGAIVRADCWAYLGPALALWCHPSAAAFAHQPRAWLVADPLKVAAWRRRLDALGPELKVGLAWRGGGEVFCEAARRSPRRLDAWAPLLRVPGVRFVNAQHGAREVELNLRELRRLSGVTVHDLGVDPVHEIDDHIALLAALDVTMIGVDQAAGQLAAALGRPAWIVLAQLPDWRWTGASDPERSLWYPSARLFRQERWGSWAEPVAAMARELAAVAGSEG